MAFCANCGSEGKGKFCAKCGASLPAEAAAAPPMPPPGYNPQPHQQPHAQPHPQPHAQQGYAPPNPGGYQPPPGGQHYQQGYAPPPGVAPVSDSGLTENVAAMLCYPLGVLTGVLFLVLEPHNKNKTVRFHAFQSIFLWISLVILSICMSILAGIMLFVPFIGRLVLTLLWPVFGLGSLALVAMLMYKAYNNERWVLPVIGPMAEKQA